MMEILTLMGATTAGTGMTTITMTMTDRYA